MIPPPPGPPPGAPPGSAISQQSPWQGAFGRMYDGRQGYNIPPPPPNGQQQPYNPRLHAQMNAIARPPPMSDKLDLQATYVPTGGTYGEGVGIPGFGPDEVSMSLNMPHASNPSNPWPHISTPLSSTETGSVSTPLDDTGNRDRLYPSSQQGRGSSNASNGTPVSSVPPEIAAQWSLDTVLIWLAKNQFSREWQRTFEALNLQGAQFLELGSANGVRGNLGTMHRQVYPRLTQECNSIGVPWDPTREREEGKRMRRLIRAIVSGKPTDSSKMMSSHGRKESLGTGQGTSLPSAGTDPADSPNVSASLRSTERSDHN